MKYLKNWQHDVSKGVEPANGAFGNYLRWGGAPYRVQTCGSADEGFVQTVSVGDYAVKTFVSDCEVLQTIEYSRGSVLVEYAKQDADFVLRALVFQTEGHNPVKVSASAWTSREVMMVTDGSMIWDVFDLHPELDPQTRFGRFTSDSLVAVEIEHWSVFCRTLGVGFTIPKHLCRVHCLEAMSAGVWFCPWQVLVLPIPDKGLCVTPIAFGSKLDSEPKKVLRTIGLSQIFGHGITAVGLAAELTRRDPTDSSYSFYVVASRAIESTVQQAISRGVNSERIRFWCYSREPGYGAALLLCDPRSLEIGATMLAFYAANPVLVEDLVTSTGEVIIFSDFPFDALFVEALLKAISRPCVVVARFVSLTGYLELNDNYDAKSPMELSVVSRLREQRQSGDLFMAQLGHLAAAASGPGILLRKLDALQGGVLLEGSFGPDYQISTGHQGIQRRGMPHASGARRHGESDMAVCKRNSLLEPWFDASQLKLIEGLHVVAIGSSPFVYLPKLIEDVRHCASHFANDVFLLVGAVSPDAAFEFERQGNCKNVGWHQDICRLLQVADSCLCRGGNIGSLCDGIAAGTPMILLAPEVPIGPVADWMSTLTGHVDDDLYNIQVANETAIERSCVFLDFMRCLERAGLPAAELVLDYAAERRSLIKALETVKSCARQYRDFLGQLPIAGAREVVEQLETIRLDYFR